MKLCVVTSKGSWRICRTGKGKFIKRLVPALEKLGVEVTSDWHDKSDVALHIGKMLVKANAKKQIVRMGPAHVDTNQDYKKLNKRKSEAIKKADGVIYQSEFCKRMCDVFLGKAKCPSTVILNGADPAFYLSAKKAVSPYRYNFLAATRKWTPQKRLKYTIKAFKMANIDDSCLWVAGDAGKYKKYACDNIRFLGILDDRQMARYYRLCDALIHMCYLDGCPNVVAEAYCSGTMAIYNSEAGTKEYYGSTDFWMIKEPEWDYRPVNLNKPPKIDVEQLATFMNAICKPNISMGIMAPWLHINEIAQQYKEFFEQCLK